MAGGSRGRVVIVGAGVVGLLAAVECVLEGCSVVVLDRGEAPNPAATSWDDQRSIRALHPADAVATHAAAEARQRWFALQRLLGEPLCRDVGVLTSVPLGDVDAATALAASAGLAAVPLDEAGVALAAPHVVFAPGHGGVLETGASVVLAARALRVVAAWLREQPEAEVRPHCEVVDVDPGAAAVRLVDGSTVRGDAVLIAAGAWSRSLLGDVLADTLTAPLVLRRQAVRYCDVPVAATASWLRTPAVGRFGSAADAWLTPPGGGARLAIGVGGTARDVGHLGEAGDADAGGEPGAVVEPTLLRGRATVRSTRAFHYLADGVTAGETFVRLPSTRAPVLAYAACGGAGFKTAPLVARRFARTAAGALA